MTEITLSCSATMNFIFIFGLFTMIGAQINVTSRIEVEKFLGETCYRDCSDTRPRVCYFDWHLEHYHVLGP